MLGIRSLDRILRILRKPPGYVLRRALREAVMEADRFLAPIDARRTTAARIAGLAGCASVDELWERLANRPFPAVVTQEKAARFVREFPAEASRITNAAERALQHRVDLLGSGDVELGEKIDWLADFVTGDRWEPDFCRSISYVDRNRPSDVKRPWELSRLQWMLPVGQTYLMTGDERYADAARDILDQWIEANPYAWTVNWSCTMEPALRILSWTWLFHVFSKSRAWTDNGFRDRFIAMLFLHGAFTERHIERSTINGNHLTADAAGMVFAGLFFSGIAAADRWADTGWRTLVEEMPRQVYADGVDFEASSAYHRLVAELFLLPARYRVVLGLDVPATYQGRLVEMGRFTAAYCAPDGDTPRWGDADDGRALPLGCQSLNDHRYLPELIASTFDAKGVNGAASSDGTELFWHTGQKWEEDREHGKRISAAFRNGGIYILADDRNQVFIDCGPVGLAGLGGHGHNDALSFEAWLDGTKIVTDSGAFVYTADFEARNTFRATGAHNTPLVDEEEINRFYSPDNLWNLKDDARPDCIHFEAGVEVSRFSGRHQGYQRLGDPVNTERTIVLDHPTGRLEIADRLDGVGAHEIAIPLHFAEDVSIRQRDSHSFELEAHGKSFSLTDEGDDGWSVAVEDALVSPSYGVVRKSCKLIWKRTGSLPAELSVKITPIRGGKD